jgi:UDP-2,3-diacylglucosamine pyrophosphatase LpxH
MSYIIVSDVHLGSESCNIEEFYDFLKWVRGLENKSETIRWLDKDIAFTSPEKIILLGDIVELWDPRDGDRDYVMKDSMVPFSLLSEIKSEKVYVVGNHDEPLGELDTVIDNVSFSNGTKFDIWNRHYPDNLRGLRIGSKFYFFLHGQQFDKEQAILAKVSKLIGESWNPLGWFQDLYNITFNKKHWKINLLIFLVLALGGWYYLWQNFLRFGYLRAFVWGMLTSFFALFSIPGLVAHYQEKIYNMNKPKDKTVEQIIQDKYYDPKKDTIRSDRVIFGHTHYAGYYGPNDETGNKLFINSGCWTGKDSENDQRFTNTFIYIDESGAYIMKWNSFGKIRCIGSFPAE